MFIIILALLFGVAVLFYTKKCIDKAKASGDTKLAKILKLVVLAEALLYTVIFIFVFLKTLFM